MCIAVVVPAGHNLRDDWISNSMDSNPDGAGFAYVKDGKVEISKGFFRALDAIEAYKEIKSMYGDNAILFHARIATAGRVDKDNCHPFRIRGGAMIHNGHLWSVDKGHEAVKSDTREFAEIFYNILDFNSVTKAIDEGDFEEVISHDKMAFLYDDGSWTTAGHFYNNAGVLFSNTGYVSARGAYWDDNNYHGYAG